MLRSTPVLECQLGVWPEDRELAQNHPVLKPCTPGKTSPGQHSGRTPLVTSQVKWREIPGEPVAGSDAVAQRRWLFQGGHGEFWTWLGEAIHRFSHQRALEPHFCSTLGPASAWTFWGLHSLGALTGAEGLPNRLASLDSGGHKVWEGGKGSDDLGGMRSKPHQPQANLVGPGFPDVWGAAGQMSRSSRFLEYLKLESEPPPRITETLRRL
jgi:hypothetical protein